METPRSEYITKHVSLIIAILAVCAVITVAILRERWINPWQTLNIVGRGTVTYVPDSAVINAAINYLSHDNIKTSLETLNNQTKKVLAEVSTLSGVTVSAYESGLSTMPNLNLDSPSNNSISAQQYITIKISNLSTSNVEVNQVLKTLAENGVNQIVSITYTQEDLNDIKQAAWEKAFEQLESNKQLMAEKAGIRFKRLSGWYENTINTGETNSNVYGMPTLSGTFAREYTIELNATYLIRP